MPEMAHAPGQLHEFEYIAVGINQRRDLYWHAPDPDRSHVALDHCARSLRGGHSGADIRHMKDRMRYRVLGRAGLTTRNEKLGR